MSDHRSERRHSANIAGRIARFGGLTTSPRVFARRVEVGSRYAPFSFALLTLALAAVSAAQPLSHDRLVVEGSPMQLRGSGATYQGVEQDSFSPEILEQSRNHEDWYEARSGKAIFFSAHLSAATSDEGLGEYRWGAGTWRRYRMFALAIAAGWYKPAPGENSFPEFIRGVAVGGGRVWMGSAGVGVIARGRSHGMGSSRWRCARCPIAPRRRRTGTYSAVSSASRASRCAL
jgi:hypothetical protein